MNRLKSLRSTVVTRTCCLALPLAVVIGGLTPLMAHAATIGFVVDPDGAINGRFDAFWEGRLESQGHSVIGVPGNISSADPSLSEIDLFIVTNDVLTEDFVNRFGVDDSRPMIIYEVEAYDEVGVSSAGDRLTNKTSIVIQDASHPLAAGLTGTVKLYDSGQTIARTGSTLGPGSTIIATLDGRAAIAVLEAGAEGLGGAPSPGQRIAFHAHAENNGKLMTDEGLALLDASIQYALIPEPATVLLAALGLAAFGWCCWRRRQREAKPVMNG